MQRHRAIATHCISTLNGVDRCGRWSFCVCHAVNPSVAVARGNGLRTSSALIHLQIQGHHTVTTRRTGQCDCRCSIFLVVSHAINPSVAVARDDIICTRLAFINRQIQRHHAVTACRIG